MYLVEAVEHRGLRVAAHPGSTHLVNAVAHLVLVVEAHDVLQSGPLQHFGSVFLRLLVEGVFVGAPLGIDA